MYGYVILAPHPSDPGVTRGHAVDPRTGRVFQTRDRAVAEAFHRHVLGGDPRYRVGSGPIDPKLPTAEPVTPPGDAPAAQVAPPRAALYEELRRVGVAVTPGQVNAFTDPQRVECFRWLDALAEAMRDEAEGPEPLPPAWLHELHNRTVHEVGPKPTAEDPAPDLRGANGPAPETAPEPPPGGPAPEGAPEPPPGGAAPQTGSNAPETALPAPPGEPAPA